MSYGVTFNAYINNPYHNRMVDQSPQTNGGNTNTVTGMGNTVTINSISTRYQSVEGKGRCRCDRQDRTVTGLRLARWGFAFARFEHAFDNGAPDGALVALETRTPVTLKQRQLRGEKIS